MHKLKNSIRLFQILSTCLGKITKNQEQFVVLSPIQYSGCIWYDDKTLILRTFVSLHSCFLHVNSPFWLTYISLNDILENLVANQDTDGFTSSNDTGYPSPVKWFPLYPHVWFMVLLWFSTLLGLDTLFQLLRFVSDKTKKLTWKDVKREFFLRWTPLRSTLTHPLPFVISRL